MAGATAPPGHHLDPCGRLGIPHSPAAIINRARLEAYVLLLGATTPDGTFVNMRGDQP
jgi:hypothetical protein